MSKIIRSELTKLITTPTWFILAGLSALLTVLPLVYALVASPGSISVGQTGAGETSLRVGSVAPLFALGVGLAAICGEFARGTAVSTFLVEPRRHRILAAKAIVCAVAGAALVLGSVVATSATLAMAVNTSDVRVSLPLGATLFSLAGSLLQGALYAVLGLGLGAFVGNQTVAAVAALGWFLVAEDALRAAAGKGLAWWLPGEAASRLTGSAEFATAAGGLAVLTASVALVVTFGTGMLVRRDVA